MPKPWARNNIPYVVKNPNKIMNLLYIQLSQMRLCYNAEI